MTQRQGRAERTRKRASAATRHFDQAWRNWKNPYPPIEQFSQDQIEAIHEASLTVLSDVGIKVLSKDARAYFGSAGMTVKGDIVHFDPEILMDLISKAPPKVTLRARGENRDATIGQGHVSVCTTGGTPNFSDLQSGRQPGTLSALDNFCKLAQRFDVIHLIGPFVEPQDIAPNLRHLHMTRSALTHTDKIPFVFFRGT